MDRSKLTSAGTSLPDNHDETKSTRPATLIQLYKLGFKLLPLSLNNAPVIKWTPIYEDPNYWSGEKLIIKSPIFKNVATVFGKSHVKDEKGLDLSLNGFDGDSEYISQILNSDQIQDPVIREKIQNLVSKSDSKSLFDFLVRNTVVVKTKKKSGLHFYWFSHKQNPRIKIEHCITGREFEIKTDKGSGHGTLPPSTHRDDPQFRYSHVGREDKIAILDDLYDILTELLSECLVKNKANFNHKNNNRKKFARLGDSQRVILNDDQINDTLFLLINCYGEGHRDSFTFEFSGFAFKRYIAEESVACIIKEICLKTNDSETKSRLEVIHRTYINGGNGSEISGSSGLKKIIATMHDGDVEQANKIVNSVIDIWQKNEIPIDSLGLNEVSSLTDEQLDKIKVTS